MFSKLTEYFWGASNISEEPKKDASIGSDESKNEASSGPQAKTDGQNGMGSYSAQYHFEEKDWWPSSKSNKQQTENSKSQTEISNDDDPYGANQLDHFDSSDELEEVADKWLKSPCLSERSSQQG